MASPMIPPPEASDFLAANGWEGAFVSGYGNFAGLVTGSAA